MDQDQAAKILQWGSGFIGAFVLVGIAALWGAGANLWPQLGCLGFFLGNLGIFLLLWIAQLTSRR